MKILGCLFGLLFAAVGISSRPYDENEISKLIKKYYSQLIDKQAQRDAIKSPKTLIVDPNIENFNIYLDDMPSGPLDEDTPDAGAGGALGNPRSPASSPCAKGHDPFGMPLPFPAFIAPLMTLLATDYTAWRSKIPKNIGCLIEDLLAVDSHPCPHENSSCVIIALPKNHVFFGCMNDQTGELVAPKRWNPHNDTDPDNSNDNYLIDFRVPNPLRLDRKCRTNDNGDPVCHRANIYYKDRIIAEDNACCCKGDFCADVLFDQHGFNPVPFIHVETDIPQRMLAEDKVAPPSEPKPDKARSRSHRQSDSESVLASNADSTTAATFNVFDWGFTTSESIAIGLIILVILIVVITIGLWFVFEREKTAAISMKSEIDPKTVDVFTVDSTDDYPFTVQKKGRSIL